MGFTKVKGKNVIWTKKEFVPDPYPNNDEGENYTFFFKKLHDRDWYARCKARYSDDIKREIAGLPLGLSPDKIILKSKKSHYNSHKSTEAK